MIRLKSALAIAAMGLLLGGPVIANPPGAPPPEILEILKKMGSGKPLSPQDQAKLDKWSKGLASGGAAAPAGKPGGTAMTAPPSNVQRLTAGDNEGGEVCPKAGHAIAAGAVTAEAYVTMAKGVRDYYGNKLPQDARGALFKVLNDRAHPVAGGDVAAAMIVRGHGSAAVTAAAAGAIANPRDPVTANTLASALRGMKDYKNATLALSYARLLSPKSTTLANNLAWLAFAQGDTGVASKLFSAAASDHRPSAQTLLGQGVIALCGKKFAQALPLFRQSLMQQWTDMAAAGVEVSEKGLQQANGAGADIGSPDAYGPKGKAQPDWPDPPVSSNPQEFAGLGKALGKYVDGWVKAMQDNQGIMTGLVTKTRFTSETEIDANSITYRHGFEREAFELNDIKNIILARDETASNNYMKSVADLQKADGPMAGGYGDGGEPNVSCAVARARFGRNHAAFMPLYSARQTQFRRKLADLWGFSAPVIATISDRDTNRSAQAALNNVVASWFDGEMAPLGAWQLEGYAAYSYKAEECKPPPVVPRPTGVLKNYPIDPNACKTPEVHMNFGIVNLNGDCAHLVLSFGELLQGSLDYKFGKDWGDDQLTVWAGANIGTKGELTNGAITGSASAGVYATFGAGGAMLDAGVQAAAGVTGGIGHEKMPDIGVGKVESGQGGGNEQLGITAKISLIDGPPNPVTGGKGVETGDGTLTSSYGFTFGGNATGSVRGPAG
jgi:hypothetical protein